MWILRLADLTGQFLPERQDQPRTAKWCDDDSTCEVEMLQMGNSTVLPPDHSRFLPIIKESKYSSATGLPLILFQF